MSASTIELERMLHRNPAGPGQRLPSAGLAGRAAPSLLRAGRRIWAKIAPYCSMTSASLASIAAAGFVVSTALGLLVAGVCGLLAEWSAEKTS